MIPEWRMPDELPGTGGSLSVFIIAIAVLVLGGALVVFARRRGVHGTVALLIGLTMAVATIGIGTRTAHAASADECPPGYHTVPGTITPTTEASATTTEAPAPKTMTFTNLAHADGQYTTPGGVDPAGDGYSDDTLSFPQFDESFGELLSVALAFDYGYSNAYYRVTSLNSKTINLTMKSTQTITFSGFPTIAELPGATWIDDQPTSEVTFNASGQEHQLTYTPGAKAYSTALEVTHTYTDAAMAPFIGTGALSATITNTFSMPSVVYRTGTSNQVSMSDIQIARGPRGASAKIQVIYTYIPAP